ncbi:MAG: efflux transporter outer membrane subunit [Rudaea sp.]
MTTARTDGRFQRSRCVVGLLCALVAGCAVGPDFKKPVAPEIVDYTAHPLATTTSTPNVAAGDAQHLVKDSDIAGDWWTLFHSQPLNDLIERSLAKNPTITAAQAALTVAKENTRAQRGAFFPSIAADVSGTRYSQPGTLAPVPSSNAFEYNLFTPQLSVSYVPDVFGLNRRTVESLQAQENAVRFQLIAAHTTLSSNLVVAAIQEGALQAQIDATREMIDINTKMLEILRYQFEKGYVGKLDVAAQETQLAQTAGTLPPLLKQLDQQHNAIAVLAGEIPNQSPAQRFDLASLQLPTDLPVRLPSELVAQRPDVQQAEANMRAANAQIGVAIANRLPSIELTGNAGSTALAIGSVFKSGTGFWSLGADIAAPIFQGGKLLHLERAAKAAYVQAAEQYRGTVLTAFQNVADSLAALEHDADSLKSAAVAADAAKIALDLSQLQTKSGYATYLTFLSAEQAYHQARIALIQAQANRYSDTAALFQALGGGWWHRADLTRTDTNGTLDEN